MNTHNVMKLSGLILRSVVFIFTIVISATGGYAADFSSYRNSSYKYAIIYPADWKIARDDGKVFSVLNKSKDVNINIVAEELGPNDRQYKKITDIPNIKKDLVALIKQMTKTPSVESGTTILSNESALWFKFRYVHKSLDVELNFIVYQIAVLKNDNRYTLTAKVSGSSKREAENKFNKFWPTIKTSLTSFTLTELAR